MATEVPADIFNYSIQAQINTSRFGNKMVRDIIALLNAADAEILAKLEKWGDSGRFTPVRLKALLREIRAMNADAYSQAHNEMKSGLLPFAEVAAESTVGLLATKLPVDFSLIGMSDTQIEAIVSRVPITVGPDKKLLLEEVFESLAAGKEEAIRGAIRLGMVQGESVQDMARRLRGTKAAQFKDGVLDVSRRHAEGMVRTTCNSVGNSAAHQTYLNNSKVVKGHIVIVTLDGHTCEKCWPNSGKRFDLDDGPVFPLHVSCRCYYLPEIRTFKEMGIDLPEFESSGRASSRGVVSSDISFPDFIKGSDKKTQVQCLGVKRQQLYATGKIPIDKFVDDKGVFYTLKELEKQNSAVFKRVFG